MEESQVKDAATPGLALSVQDPSLKTLSGTLK